jgi:hypothetical protein
MIMSFLPYCPSSAWLCPFCPFSRRSSSKNGSSCIIRFFWVIKQNRRGSSVQQYGPELR